MPVVNPKITLLTARNYIEQLDLTYVVETMCSTRYPLPRWTLQDANYCLRLYKNFLFLQKKYLPEFLVPSREIDEFWHNHILHTKSYSHDCLKIFGHYLHHQPLSPNADPQGLIADYLKTKQRYLEEFNHSMEIK